MDSAISFGKVYIIEWLPPNELKTGCELFDELQPIGLLSKPEVEVSFAQVKTRDEFIAYLRSIADDFKTTRKLPLIRIETHGLDDGEHSTGICSSPGDAAVARRESASRPA
jgi:hypothetical protein